VYALETKERRGTRRKEKQAACPSTAVPLCTVSPSRFSFNGVACLAGIPACLPACLHYLLLASSPSQRSGVAKNFFFFQVQAIKEQFSKALLTAQNVKTMLLEAKERTLRPVSQSCSLIFVGPFSLASSSNMHDSQNADEVGESLF